MSDKFLTILALVAVAGAIIYVMRDRIPSPTVSRDRPFVASNKHRVVPALEAENRFEVWSQPGSAGPQYFCAAAEYARKVLRAEMNDVVVTETAEAPSETSPRHRSVFFSLHGSGDSQHDTGGVVLDLSKPGQARTVAVALQFCR